MSYIESCMGGWCTRRDQCPHYWSPGAPFSQPAERLCPREPSTAIEQRMSGMQRELDKLRFRLCEET